MELRQVGRKLGGWRTTLVLVHLRPSLDSVGPMKWEPKRHPFINRALEQRGGLTYLLFAKCCPKGIAQVTNHLMGGHPSAKALTLGTYPVQSIEHFVAVGYIEESFHFGKAKCDIETAYREGILYHSIDVGHRLLEGTAILNPE